MDSAHLVCRNSRGKGDGDGDENLLDEADAHSPCELLSAGPTRSSVRNQRVVQKNVVTDESALRRCPGIFNQLTAWCTSSRGNLRRIWMCLCTRISRGVWPLGGAPREVQQSGARI